MCVNRKIAFVGLLTLLLFSCGIKNRFEKDYQNLTKRSQFISLVKQLDVDKPEFCVGTILFYSDFYHTSNMIVFNALVENRFSQVIIHLFSKHYQIARCMVNLQNNEFIYYVHYKDNYYFSNSSDFKRLQQISYDPIFYILDKMKAEGISLHKY